MDENIYYCPINGWDCPYFRKDGTCELGTDALSECEDAMAMEECLNDDSDTIYCFCVDGVIIPNDPMS